MVDRTLTRADLTDSVVSEIGLGRQECAGLVDRTLALICGALEEGEPVKLSGFGVFQVREKRARMVAVPRPASPPPSIRAG